MESVWNDIICLNTEVLVLYLDIMLSNIVDVLINFYLGRWREFLK